MHTCKQCGETDLSKFYTRSDNGKPRGLCKICLNFNSLTRYSNKKEEISIKEKKYREDNKDRIKQRKAIYYLDNKEYILNRCSIYRTNNKEKYLEYSRKWRKSDIDRYRKLSLKQTSLRRARKLQATFNEMSEWHQFLLDEIYDLSYLRSKITGIIWHVDHIIPLKSKLVCGLHHPNNLQVIPATENLRKGNRLKI